MQQHIEHIIYLPGIQQIEVLDSSFGRGLAWVPVLSTNQPAAGGPIAGAHHYYDPHEAQAEANAWALRSLRRARQEGSWTQAANAANPMASFLAFAVIPSDLNVIG